MSITKEQIEEMLKGDDKELINQVVSAAMQTETGRTILNNHLETSSKAIKDTAYQAGQNSVYGFIDKVLPESGIEIPSTISKASEKVTFAIKALNQKIADIKKDAPADSTKEIGELKAKILEINKLAETDKDAYNTKLAKMSSENSIAALNSIGFEFDPSQAKAAVEAMKSAEINKLIKGKSVTEAGKVFYNDPDGKPYLNPKTRDYATAKEILTIKLADVLAKSNGGGGADSTTTTVTGATIADNNDITLDKSKFSTTVELHKEIRRAMALKGITVNTPEDRWNKIFAIGIKKYDKDLKEY